MILGLSFAMLLNTSLLGPLTKAIFRVVYILPWVFTATIIAILWRLMLDPYGVINYILNTLGLANGPVEWLSSRQLALPLLYKALSRSEHLMSPSQTSVASLMPFPQTAVNH